MDDFLWNPAVQHAYNSFVWDEVEQSKPPAGGNNVSSGIGLLEQVGADYASILFDIQSRDLLKQHGLKPESKEHLPSPRYSSLSTKQHIQYLSMEEKFRHRRLSVLSKPLPSDQLNPLNIYKKLHSKVIQEQEEFSAYAFQDSIHHISDYNKVVPLAEQYFENYLSMAKDRLRMYMQNYIFLQGLQINAFPYTSDPQPKFEKLIVKLGTTPVIKKPPFDTLIPSYDVTTNKEVHQKPITKDENAEKLAVAWKADIVISLSALRTLADNTAPFANESEIPMEMRKIKDPNGNFRQVVFIDKALPPKSVYARDKNLRYFKKAVKNFILHSSNYTSKGDGSFGKNIFSDEVARRELNEEKSLNEIDASTEEDTEGVLESDQSIPQLDGVDDSVDGVSTIAATKRKKRISSVPQSVAQAAGLSVWKKSLSRLPKAAVKPSAGSTSLLNFNFTKSVKSKSPERAVGQSTLAKAVNTVPTESGKKQPEPESDSEDGSILIIDDDEAEVKGSDDFSESAATEAQQSTAVAEKDTYDLSFTSAEVPSNYLQTLGNESSDNFLSTEQSLHLKLRRSARKKSNLVSDKEKPQETEKQKSTVSADKPRRLRSASSTKLSNPGMSKPVSKVSAKSLRRKSTSQSKADVPKKSRKITSNSRVEFSDNNDIGETVADPPEEASTGDAKVVDTTTMQKAEDTKTFSLQNTVHGDDSLNSHEKEGTVDFPTQADTALGDTKTAMIIESEQLQLAKDALLKDVENKLGSFDKATAPEKASSTIDQSHSIAKNVKTTTQDAEPNDLLGQILGMQKEREERTVKEISNVKNKDVPLQRTMPTVPSPMLQDDPSFDEILAMHNANLSNDTNSVFYNLWSIGNIRVVVRGCLHGKMMSRYPADKKGNGFENATIRTKLEYQSDLGFEQLTKSEACAEWVDLQFRPQPSTVLRCRVDPFTQKILRVDEVRNEQSTYQHFEAAGFSYLAANKMLLSFFQKLIAKDSFGPFMHIVSHKSGSSEFIIRVADPNPSNKKVVYDLIKEYANPGRVLPSTPQSFPWIPLDPGKQTSYQHRVRQVPMTFEIQRSSSEVPAKKKKKKNKGKKKKKKSQFNVSD